uniref:Uncharacterized protein n=1 Tax=Anguilla anguilla TaxID=7936 RepID=A0A0E9PUA9_ANGAN
MFSHTDFLSAIHSVLCRGETGQEKFTSVLSFST